MTDFSLSPTQFNLSQNTDAVEKAKWFFGHYDLRIYISNKAYMDVGRGSFGASIRCSHAFTDYAGCVAEIGQFCEFSSNTEFLPGGEHRNTENVNVTFSTITPFQMAAAKHGVASLRPKEHAVLRIGHGVIVSTGAMILGGVSIGDGAVIGAKAVVTKDIEPFAIVAGIPAKKLRNRVSKEIAASISAVRWWDFDTLYLGNNIANLQELAVDTKTQHVYRKPTPRFALKLIKTNNDQYSFQVLGVQNGENLIPIQNCPEHIKKYILQIGTQGPYEWHPNIWDNSITG